MQAEVTRVEKISAMAMLAGLAVCISYFLVYLFFPASYWMEVEEFDILDGPVPNDVVYTRVIRHEFDGAWKIRVATKRNDGWELVCEPVGWVFLTYDPEDVVPAGFTTKDMLWPARILDENGDSITGGCWDLPPGEYRVRADWRINEDEWLERELSVRDDFTVTDDEDQPPR